MGEPSPIRIDIEPTNRCNADCYFCPRDQTPHLGLMSPETYIAALDRSEELRRAASAHGHEVAISFCGLGEPLLNKHVPTFIRQARDRGFTVSMSSNAGLLDERRAREVLDAGLQQIDINVGERGESYEDIYKLDWERTRDNIIRFVEMAEGRCEVNIILVNHRGDPQHLIDMQEYWRQFGLDKFFSFDLINRGGSLYIDRMQFERLPTHAEAEEELASTGEAQLCQFPFAAMVVGYDGHYYLCCSDWKKEYSLGTVHEVSFVDILGEKVEMALRKASICLTCNLNPINALAEAMQARDLDGTDPADAKWAAAIIRTTTRSMNEMIGNLDPRATPAAQGIEPVGGRISRRRAIPVTSA